MGSPQSAPSNISPQSPSAQNAQNDAQNFGQLLQTVVGGAFTAAGYVLEANPTHHARGLFRFAKALPDDVTAFIEFQLLVMPSTATRFRVNLLRNIGRDARAVTKYPQRIDIPLSKLVWEQFGVRSLPSADHWWEVTHPSQLAHQIVEAGKLAIGFGMPFLDGSLRPDPSENT